jgi:hypothetical protein
MIDPDPHPAPAAFEFAQGLNGVRSGKIRLLAEGVKRVDLSGLDLGDYGIPVSRLRGEQAEAAPFVVGEEGVGEVDSDGLPHKGFNGVVFFKRISAINVAGDGQARSIGIGKCP